MLFSEIFSYLLSVSVTLTQFHSFSLILSDSHSLSLTWITCALSHSLSLFPSPFWRQTVQTRTHSHSPSLTVPLFQSHQLFFTVPHSNSRSPWFILFYIKCVEGVFWFFMVGASARRFCVFPTEVVHRIHSSNFFWAKGILDVMWRHVCVWWGSKIFLIQSSRLAVVFLALVGVMPLSAEQKSV